MRTALASLALWFLAVAPLAAAEPAPIDYLRDIRPLLARACYNCHGPDEGERKAGLRLDRRSDATSPLETGSREASSTGRRWW